MIYAQDSYWTSRISSRAVRHVVCSVLLFLFVLSGTAVKATESRLEEERVTAAFIYNFIKFVTWPELTFERKKNRLLVCTNESDSLGGALASLNNRTVEGVTLEVQYLLNGKGFPLTSCDVLYIDNKALQPEYNLSSPPRGLLVIGHSQPGVRPSRSIVFRKVDNKIRFDVYLGEANRAGLEVSSFLLKLALNVYE